MMNFLIPFPLKQHAITRRLIPAHYQRFSIPHARPFYTKGDFGDFLIQVLNCPGFIIQLNIFNIEKKICLLPQASRPIIALHFMLFGNIACWLKGFGKALLTEGIANLFFVPAREKNKAWLEPGKYISFHINNTRKFLKRLSGEYPEIGEVLTRAAGRSSKGVQQHPARITSATRMIIDQILKCEDREPERSLFLEAKVSELLLLYVKDNSGEEEKKMTLKYKKTGHALEKYVAAHLNHPLDIKSLAEQLGISIYMLKNICKNMFDQSVHRFILDKRLQKAQQLLLETDLPIKQISSITGLGSTSTFTDAFRKATGYPPGKFRNQK